MPEIHHLDQTVFGAYAIVDEIRIAPQASDISCAYDRAFLILGIPKASRRVRADALQSSWQPQGRRLRCTERCLRVAHCSRRENYFVSHRPTISRTRSTGTPRPASSSVAALSSEASKAASSLSDIRG